jgi:hypothetical protein
MSYKIIFLKPKLNQFGTLYQKEKVSIFSHIITSIIAIIIITLYKNTYFYNSLRHSDDTICKKYEKLCTNLTFNPIQLYLVENLKNVKKKI